MAAGRYQRFFYHSFPKPRTGQDTDAVGLAILDLVCRIGFLLTPEAPVFDQAKGTAAAQTRLCLTELHETELARHAEQFGPFAFEIDIDAARRLGAMPVIYIPQPVGHGQSRFFDEFGLRVVERLADIQRLLQFLADIEDNVSSTQRGQWTLQRAPDRPKVELEARVLNDLILNLRSDVKFVNLAATMKGISGLFYKVDNDYELVPQLEYYRQREWRIVSDLIGDSGRNSRRLTDTEATEVADSNPKFFNGILPWTDGYHPRITLCQVLHFQPRAWPMLVKRILVPSHLVEKAKRVKSVARLGLPVEEGPQVSDDDTRLG